MLGCAVVVLCCVLLLPCHNHTSGDEAGAEELRKELLKAKAKMIAAMQRQAGERVHCRTPLQLLPHLFTALVPLQGLVLWLQLPQSDRCRGSVKLPGTEQCMEPLVDMLHSMS